MTNAIDIRRHMKGQNLGDYINRQIRLGEAILAGLDDEDVAALHYLFFQIIQTEVRIGLGISNLPESEVAEYKSNKGTPLFDLIDGLYQEAMDK